jgi:hypothetical protein
MKTRWPAAFLLLVLLFAVGGSAARTGDRESQKPPAAGSTDIGRGNALPVLFYSGRNDNKDVYILHPGEKEPRNLTDHPAWDGWACYLPVPKR